MQHTGESQRLVQLNFFYRYYRITSIVGNDNSLNKNMFNNLSKNLKQNNKQHIKTSRK